MRNPCEVCGNPTPRRTRCTVCDKLLCSDCTRIHRNWFTGYPHPTKRPGATVLTRPEHTGRPGPSNRPPGDTPLLDTL